ncbi:MAG TPA: YbdD/YjiX family protein [Gammaproteobacteria bacterium]|jgi:uncharacterized short protein YbdD (DUF466 family)
MPEMHIHSVRTLAAALWRGLRALSGDDAYERYLEHCRLHHPGRPLPERREFFAARLAGKWSGIARCC